MLWYGDMVIGQPGMQYMPFTIYTKLTYLSGRKKVKQLVTNANVHSYSYFNIYELEYTFFPKMLSLSPYSLLSHKN